MVVVPLASMREIRDWLGNGLLSRKRPVCTEAVIVRTHAGYDHVEQPPTDFPYTEE